ncbi:MAG: thiamine phosphate synthase [Muribaculaceae bacterium]
MIIVGITSEDAIGDEPLRVQMAIDAGVDYVHVRKPNFSDQLMRTYLNAIQPSYLSHITLGSNRHLANEYAVGGVHIKGNEPALNAFSNLNVRLSKSCHIIQEVEDCPPGYSYCFLSPIFNSISKPGYQSHFTLSELTQYANQGLLQRVVALGGLTPSNVAQIRHLPFCGFAFSGHLFSPTLGVSDFKNNLNEIIKLTK